MTEIGTESAALTWSVSECPFTIETSARVMDDIRLAVTDAFFSLPRGGAEIGGILLGTYRDDKVLISGYAALDCEHAFGPSFQLSPADEERLTQLLAAHDGCAGGLRPVGWYHSHTRTEIFLTDTDLGIYRRFFPEAFQVALVLRPHTFEPARYGFFFRQADGAIYARASRREEQLEALAVRQVPAGPPSAAESPVSQPRNPRPAQTLAPIVDIPPARVPDAPAPVLETTAPPPPSSAAPFLVPTPSPFSVETSPEPASSSSPFVVPTPPSSFSPAPPTPSPFAVPPPPPVVIPSVAAASEPAFPALARTTRDVIEPPRPSPVPAEVQAPKFTVASASSARKWMTAGIAFVGVLGVLATGFKTQAMWLPRLVAAIRPAQSSAAEPAATVKPAVPAPALGLTTFDREGQLQISWDRASASVRDAAYAVLEISEDGSVPKAIQLDSASLQSGSFTYQRTTAKVDLRLVIHQKQGPDLRESSSFLGQAPAVENKPQVDSAALKQREAAAVKERDELAKQAAKMKADLNAQAVKTKKLEKDMQAIRLEMRKQQQRRLANQAAGK